MRFTTASPFGNRMPRRLLDLPAAMQSTPEVIKAGELEIRPSEYLALAGGRALTLSVRELDLLAALGRREGRIVPREELYETVWGTRMRASDRSVDVYVHKLRSKLATALPEWRFIHTHFGFGYRFQPELSQRFHKAATSR
jgi:DNA-binding response OmpR family regulator